ncbi:dihydroxyacetone kinase family protein [Cryobacterium sp. PH29-G1]|uniref:dihydroxyacetone kinase family protein n=1 Tax=Cryobacterium sp. PH29-G1 TaxID=3046211 RepID=UPI0024BA7CF6|nr:dihydroxyacetone kinase family protein [Cryobacterium sp. PH29-G1]MDJ0350758.1 dihydroxyacetone kinase family protein [Cryobacterium sp. PH29-G1]
MTRIFNNPTDFPQELIEGFVAAYPELVMAVPGGVVRATEHDDVAVIVGGGTGHYPMFCGLVGGGLAHGAAMGNLFSSPSAQQAYSVARAAERGHGVIFTFGNYAGDVMHFGEAVDRLRRDGIAADVVLVTDDIASASPEEKHKRRGIAGNLTVFKILGAAAEAGYDFADTIRVGQHANDRTRSFGVAFAGCTLPGATAPLFTVPDGMMSLGLGIHGEPGISDVPIPSAAGLAELLVERTLAERPNGADGRVAVLLNGLGTVKYEELFVVYRTVAQLLADAGLQIVAPDIGELCTSLDMAGVSLTLFWLDDELERLWAAPATTPAYLKGRASQARVLTTLERDRVQERVVADEVDATFGTPESRRGAQKVLLGLDALTNTVIDAADELGRIDAVAGDGDHGIGMERGSRAALDAAEKAALQSSGAGTVLRLAGERWADIAGGTSGALWGAGLQAIGDRLGDESSITAAQLVLGIGDARTALTRLGGAQLGDKTMMDVLIPYAEELERLRSSEALTPEGWLAAAELSRDAAARTRNLVPKIGRARPLAERSVGTPDAGATSIAMIISAVTQRLTTPSDASTKE